ncbi:uncharacterized protein LOC143464517 [Clavelina lepadiformis]|uniref:uncharacterized protein LOC143464517 n=1 Tax=Clavelina lepadiformis TaxID=159417 RepID=UPI004041D41C
MTTLSQIFIILTMLSVSCESWNWDLVYGDEDCTKNCNGLRRRMCDGVLCNEGILSETFTNCPYPFTCGTFISTDYERKCAGSCDRAVEQVKGVCSAHPSCIVRRHQFCTVAESCTGQWSEWSQFQTTSDGRVQRERRCYDLRNPTTLSTSCDGSRGRYDQTEYSSTNKTKPRKISKGSNCYQTCSDTPEYTDKEKLSQKCKEALVTAGLLQESTCKWSEQLMVSCETPIDQPVCAVANFESCTSYEQWTEWIEWTLSGNGRQYRRRMKWCSNPFNLIGSLPCHKTVKIEQDCTTGNNNSSAAPTVTVPGPTQWLGVPMWVYIILGVLALIIIMLVVCLCIKRKRRKPKGPNVSPQNGVEMRNHPVTSKPATEQLGAGSENPNSNRGAQQNMFLSVGQRFIRASEHLYETISRRSRIFSRTSSEGTPRHTTFEHHPMGEHEVPKNEYILCNDSPQRKEATQQSVVKRPKGANGNPKLRISVTVTDPDGIQVGKNVYKPKLKTVESNQTGACSDKPLGKTRWSRVATPQPATTTKFFPEKKANKSPVQQVASVKYSTAKENVSPGKSPKKLDLRKILARLAVKPAGSQTGPPHHYDVVPKEDVLEEKPRIEVEPPTNNARFEEDDRSIWSDSTFDGRDCSDIDVSPPASEETNASLKGNLNYTKPKRSRKDSRRVAPFAGESSVRSANLPPLPPKIFTPNTDVRSPLPNRWPDQTVDPGHFQFPKSNLSPPATTNSVDYTHMNAVQASRSADSADRKDVRSWMQLGAPPCPQKIFPAGKSEDKNEDEERKLKLCSIEAKYVTPVHAPKTLNASKDMTVDSHGYLHLC